MYNTFIPPMRRHNMVEVQYSPIEKIVIHEAIKYDLGEFISFKVNPRAPNQRATPFRWVDGIVFDFASVIPTEQLVNERVQDGVVHWDFIEFAEMPKYQSNLINHDNGSAWKVIDGATNTAVMDAIRWLKNQPQWFPKTRIAQA